MTKNTDNKTTDTKGDAGVSEVADRVAEENEQGFIGEKVDPRPNEDYTVEGVTSNK